jgi:hypothetical protein
LRQIDGLLAAIQYVFLGKMPLSFMGPEILMGILRNVSLNLPDGYEMATGTKMENIHAYHDLVKTEVIADLHSLKMVMKIPLKTADRQFTLYKLVATPSRISGNKFFQYQPDFSYLAVAYNRRDYLLLDTAHVQLCTSGSTTICPSVTALYDVQTVSCEASLFFQYEDGRRVCTRRLLLDYDLPTLRHGGVWIYHFPDSHQVSI